MSPPTVLITGASRGIGRASTLCFAGAGYRVYALARSAEALRELQAQRPGEDIIPVVCDLTDPQPYLLPDITYDVVLLNAAQYAPGGLLDPQRDVFAAIWPLNVLANHRLAHRLLPSLRERGRGHLVVIGSVATDHTPPHMTAYAATKKALRALYEGWEQELAGTGVLTTLVAPGPTLTSSWVNETPPPDILQPEEVADTIYRAVAEERSGRIVVS